MKKSDIPNFKTKDELFDFLIENKEDLVYAKKSETKHEDSLVNAVITQMKTIETSKKSGDGGNENEIKVRAVINTTNYLDSHGDVHIKGLWNRSIKNNKNIKMLQEHEMRFDKVIADKEDLDVYVKEYDWKDLGYDVEGKTQALVFDATVKMRRNKFMFDQYNNKDVDNHSVGMRYLQIKLAMNSNKDNHKNEKEVWDKYYTEIANKADADKAEYFWAVLEASAIEGSAVVLGSNQITPTLTRSKEHLKEDNLPDIESPEKQFMNKFKI